MLQLDIISDDSSDLNIMFDIDIAFHMDIASYIEIAITSISQLYLKHCISQLFSISPSPIGQSFKSSVSYLLKAIQKKNLSQSNSQLSPIAVVQTRGNKKIYLVKYVWAQFKQVQSKLVQLVLGYSVVTARFQMMSPYFHIVTVHFLFSE